jgi:hypothetical protein
VARACRGLCQMKKKQASRAAPPFVSKSRAAMVAVRGKDAIAVLHAIDPLAISALNLLSREEATLYFRFLLVG